MKRIVFCCFAFAGMTILAPEDAFGQKKAAKQGGNVLTAGAQEYALLSKYKEMVGTIQSVDKDSLVLRVDYDHPVPKANNPTTTNNTPRPRVNPNVNRTANNGSNQLRNTANHIQQQIHKIQQDQAALARAKTSAQLQQRIAQLRRDEQKLQMELYQYQVQQARVQQQQLTTAIRAQNTANSKMTNAHDFIDFDLPFMTTTAIRRLTLGVEYDDKGNVKEGAGKTSSTMPGYSARMDDLKAGEKVKVYLSPAKAAAKKDGDPGNRPQARMVVILDDNTTGLTANNNKKKAK